MPNDADRAGTPAGVFGAELRYYRTRAGLSQKDLASRANVSHDVISKIETGERQPAEDFPPRLDAIPELDTRGALTRLWELPEEGPEAAPARLVPAVGGHRGRGDGAALIRAARRAWPAADGGLRPGNPQCASDGSLDDLDEQVAARLARQAVLECPNGPQLWCVLDEGVLHCAIGGSKVMRSQLYRLAEVTEHQRPPSRSSGPPVPTRACWPTS